MDWYQVAAILLAVVLWLVPREKAFKFVSQKRRAIGIIVYTVFALVLTYFFARVIWFLSSNTTAIAELALLAVLMLWALVGIWAALLRRLSMPEWVSSALDITHLTLFAVTLLGFWFTQWPDIYAPLVVTLSIAVMFAAYFIVKKIEKRKNA